MEWWPSTRSSPKGMNWSESVVSVRAGIAVSPVTSGEGHVYHFTSGDEVRAHAAAEREQFAQKPLSRFAEHGWLVAWIHAVAMELDEDPVRTTAYSNRRALPT